MRKPSSVYCTGATTMPRCWTIGGGCCMQTAPTSPCRFAIRRKRRADRRAAQTWLDRYHQRLDQEGRPVQERIAAMDAVNPLYVLRNHLAEQAIRAAVQGDASEIATLLRLLAQPYRAAPGCDAYADPAPDWAASLHVSCSS